MAVVLPLPYPTPALPVVLVDSVVAVVAAARQAPAKVGPAVQEDLAVAVVAVGMRRLTPRSTSGVGGPGGFAGGAGGSGGAGGGTAAGAGGGGGGMGGAIFNFGGSVSIVNSTLSANTAQGGDGASLSESQGAGGSGYGGGFFNLNGAATVLNSTFASNTVTAGSGGTPQHDGGGFTPSICTRVRLCRRPPPCSTSRIRSWRTASVRRRTL